VVILFIFCQALCNFEEDVYTTISKDWQVKPMNYCMQGVSFISSPTLSIVPPVVFYVNEKRDIAKHGFINFFGNFATVFSLKYLINRQRPNGDYERWDSSFPSGHTTFAFSQAVIYSHHYPGLTIPLYLFAATVGFSRMYLGEHYPTDVIGGAVLGLVTGYLTIKLCK
jgi:undecaprenyl-diphosphatase